MSHYPDIMQPKFARFEGTDRANIRNCEILN